MRNVRERAATAKSKLKWPTQRWRIVCRCWGQSLRIELWCGRRSRSRAIMMKGQDISLVSTISAEIHVRLPVRPIAIHRTKRHSVVACVRSLGRRHQSTINNKNVVRSELMRLQSLKCIHPHMRTRGSLACLYTTVDNHLQVLL